MVKYTTTLYKTLIITASLNKSRNDKLLWIGSKDAILIQNSLKKYRSAIVLIFIVWMLVSSIATVALIGNISIVFAKKLYAKS
jgi:hypothetical protein